MLKRILLIQLSLLCVATYVASHFYGSLVSISITAGFLACFLPQTVFYIISSPNTASNKDEPQNIASAFTNRIFIAQSIKFVLTIVIFGAIFIVVNVIPVFVFLSFIITQILNWVLSYKFIKDVVTR